MENTNRDPAQDATPQNDWRNAETDLSHDGTALTVNTETGSDAEEVNEPFYVTANDPDPDDEDEKEEDEEEEDEDGDWGHVDPAEGNSPFLDSNDPSGPGSAV